MKNEKYFGSPDTVHPQRRHDVIDKFELHKTQFLLYFL